MLPHLRDALRCPRHPLAGRLAESPGALHCAECGARYPVTDGIPDMVGDAPEHLSNESDQWDRHAPDYDAGRSIDPIYMAGVHAVLAGLDPRPHELVLDAGCGTGLTTRQFHRPGMNTVALDLSMESLRRLRTRLPAGHTVGLVRGDLSALPFAPGAFDKVLCANALQQLPGDDLRRRCAAGLARVARPGATVVVSAHNFSRPKQKAGWCKEGSSGSHSGAVDYIYRFGADELEAMLGDYLNVRSVRGAGLPLFYRLKLSPLMRQIERIGSKMALSREWGNMLVAVCEARTGSPSEVVSGKVTVPMNRLGQPEHAPAGATG
jgi:ubiquinone/menaquinone biosynthesis C-methylase UbiE/uncharacterized protein YbaR (Trm112 family)